MTRIRTDAPWHRQTYDRFLQSTFPELLAERLPLAGYQADITGEYSATVTVAVAEGPLSAEVTISDVPAPDEDGIFLCERKRLVVIPIAENEHLDRARIRCVGEQFFDYVADRLGRAPDSVKWDADLLSSWVPLDQWLHDYLSPAVQGTGVRPRMPLDSTNWLSERSHLRRIFIEDFDDVIAPGQLGLACPVESPEGPNLGHVLSIAVGAEIRDEQLVRVEHHPSAILGLTASMIPLVEYDDINRGLMGANMMRQWLAPADREPALVQSGNEPEDAAFWCGRNLLTAFISWGGDTFEDAIVVSQSAATKLDSRLSVGDKLSNRHGTKGVIGRILPDADMPHLQDGTPVELCCSYIACHARLNPGQIREAVLGRIAQATGQMVTARPFEGPDDDALRQMLHSAELHESGMESLTLGAKGSEMERPSTVGYVYWGQTLHRAVEKLKVFVAQDDHQTIGEMEYLTLRDAGAMAVIDDLFKVQNVDGVDDQAILSAVRTSGEPKRPQTTPHFNELVGRLRSIGIEVSHHDRKLTFGFGEPADDAIVLAEPVEHPWREGQSLTYVAPAPAQLAAAPTYVAAAPAHAAAVGLNEALSVVRSANDRLARLIADGSPSPLLTGAREHLQGAVESLADAVVQPLHLKPRARVLFSARGVIAPGAELAHERIGLPEPIAWGLFGPVIESDLGADAVAARTAEATTSLDRVMAERWVVVVRAPAVLPTSVLAFRPVRIEDPAIRLPPQALALMNADHDGDQVAVFLPVTADAQVEARQKLSIAAHLSRDSEFVLPLLVPRNEPLWALADVSRRAGGLKKIAGGIGVELSAPEGIVTVSSLQSALAAQMASGGASAVLDTIGRIYSFGFAHAKISGASMSPFIADVAEALAVPQGNDLSRWERYHVECEQRLITLTDYDDGRIGPQLLSVRSGARGNAWQLRALAVLFGLIVDAAGNFTPAPTCVARGRSPEEFWHCAAGARRGLANLISQQQVRQGQGLSWGSQPEGLAPLARAMRSDLPGVVFAHAAAIGEVDPLADIDSQRFVGV